LAAGDSPVVAMAERRSLVLEVVLTALVLVTVVAMVRKWGAAA
jgi:hypothetical protein